ncbi:MAG: putative dehydrogenase [Halocynthiibacter sp.]|jgi:predicted dehydrogenase
MKKLGIGIIGCGNISAAYLKLSPLFKALEMRAVADMNMEAAEARAKEFGVRAETVEGLLAADDISLVLNLTIPDAHFAVTKQILEAGKHAYSEKPMVLSLEEGETLREIAAAKGLRVGSAPDTWMGGAHQAARAIIDSGEIGEITSGTAHVMSAGMEMWHPNPDFFFLPGGGPMLDLGPYYVTNLVQLLGPVKRLAALTSSASPTRTITSEPRNGEKIPVKTPTNIHALLEFVSGATITLSTSWDVFSHRHANMELYGTKGSIYVPDPNFFGGKVETAGKDGVISELAQPEHPFGVPNQDHKQGMVANYRTAGLADMAQAIVEGRPHRCSLELALHVVEVMTSALKSGEEGRFIEMQTSCARPAAVTPDEAAKLLG